MDQCFANETNHKLIQQLYPVSQFQINVCTFQLKNVQLFNLSLEKLENMIQLRISDAFASNKMYLCTIDGTTYQEIKTEQSLCVNFQGFIDHLVTILDSCKKNELFITLVQNDNRYVLQFYEKRSLKNLIHLFLRVKEAEPVIIMYHMNLTLTKLKDEAATLTSQNNFLQNEVNKRDFHIQESEAEIAVLKQKIAENENMILHRNTEEIKRLNQEIKNIETNKEFEENRLKALVKTYEIKVDQLTRDNFAINDKLLLETKKCETLRHELDDMKKKLNAISADNNRLKNNLNSSDNKEKQHRKRIDDLHEQMVECEEKLRLANKEKSNLQAEMEAERQICSTKKRALQIATDELAKNQETISQHERLIEKLKRGIDWRTLVLLRMNNEMQQYQQYQNYATAANIEKFKI
ncbi:hypothetical protein PVAND_001382 [Polypedilum vanderplanki]|uniref:Spindle assembly abnormal protein 6 N-terminal domain-containing protein n=1 Tax=Polypedilum vanderplanki TaxID=319348 RepID=A0A9J6BP28_POLVA|nr:hypothetical protein PVAND_001382 [Polypedilum vanderplanki]